MSKRKRIPTYLQILAALILGLGWGFITISTDIPESFTLKYIAPFGEIFLNALLMIAIPLVFFSLVDGIANLKDMSKFSRMGGKTILIYLCTTCIAIVIGLSLVNIFQPGKVVPVNLREELATQYQQNAEEKFQGAEAVTQQRAERPLEPLVDIIPQNLIESASSNSNMLQIVFFAILLGLALLQIPKNKSEPVLKVFSGINEAILKIIGYIMIIAPLGVFALMANFVVETEDPDVLVAVGAYGLVVLGGLATMILIVYPVIFRIFTKIKYLSFFRAIFPAQLVAFSTSSSSATLPVTIRRCEENLGIKEEASGFVLPLGATINMDGTSLYQAIAAVFIAQVYNMQLGIGEQLTILVTAVLASIGSAGVPGAGMVMLIIVLKSVGVPEEGIILILAPDRLLDMCRTMVNVTGDATVASVVASSENLLDTKTANHRS